MDFENQNNYLTPKCQTLKGTTIVHIDLMYWFFNHKSQPFFHFYDVASMAMIPQKI